MSKYRTIVGILVILVCLSNQLYGQCTDCPTEGVELYIEADNLNPVPGDIVCYNVIADGFQSVLSVVFSISFTSNTLTFSSDNTNGTGIPEWGDAFVPPTPNSNVYRVFWIDGGLATQCLDDGTVLVELCFEVIGNPGQGIRVEIGNNGISQEPEFTFFDEAGNVCTDVSTLPDLDRSRFNVPDIIQAPCTGGLEVFSNEICGTPNNLERGKVRLDFFCGVGPYDVSIDGTRNINGVTDTNIEVDNLRAGSRIISVTDANGDRVVQTIEILDAVELTIDPLVVMNPRCSDDATPRGRIEVEVSGGTPFSNGDYLFDWGDDNLSNDPQLSRLRDGEVTLIVSDSLGCSATETFTLVQPTILPTSVVTGPTCDGLDNGSIRLTATGGRPINTDEYNFRLDRVIDGGALELVDQTPFAMDEFTINNLGVGQYIASISDSETA